MRKLGKNSANGRSQLGRTLKQGPNEGQLRVTEVRPRCLAFRWRTGPSRLPFIVARCFVSVGHFVLFFFFDFGPKVPSVLPSRPRVVLDVFFRLETGDFCRRRRRRRSPPRQRLERKKKTNEIDNRGKAKKQKRNEKPERKTTTTTTMSRVAADLEDDTHRLDAIDLLLLDATSSCTLHLDSLFVLFPFKINLPLPCYRVFTVIGLCT